MEDSIRLKSIVIGGGGQFSIDAMDRALLRRSRVELKPSIKQSSLAFEHSRYKINTDSNPCATSIVWTDVKNKYENKSISFLTSERI